MTIIVQTGHYSSYSQELMDKLYQRGLNRPLVSFNHQITADKVSESLIKIANKSIGLLDNKLADSLAVDLLLGNLAQSEWGWNHPDNLIAINYWEQLDKDSRFILVFDHPKYLFNRMVDSELTIDLLDEMVQDWIDYHKKLLTTYEQLDKKAILLEGKVAIKNLGNVKTEIQSIAHSLQLKSLWQLPIEKEKTETKHEEKISKEILIDEIIKEYPEMLIVYEKLLQKAKVKTAKSSLYNKQRKLSKLITCLNQERAEQSQQMLALAYQDELQQEHKKLVESNQKVEELNKKLKDAELIKSQLEDAKKLMIQKDKQISDENLAIKKEHELLIAQLYQVQEELEKYYLQNQKQQEKLAESNKNAEELNKKLKEAEQTKHQLEDTKKLVAQKDQQIANEKSEVAKLKEQLKQVSVSSIHDESIKQENELLIAQLYQVQEELEKYYIDNQNLKKKINGYHR